MQRIATTKVQLENLSPKLNILTVSYGVLSRIVLSNFSSKGNSYILSEDSKPVSSIVKTEPSSIKQKSSLMNSSSSQKEKISKLSVLIRLKSLNSMTSQILKATNFKIPICHSSEGGNLPTFFIPSYFHLWLLQKVQRKRNSAPLMRQESLISTTKILNFSKNTSQNLTRLFLVTIAEQRLQTKKSLLERLNVLVIWHFFHMSSKFV